MSSILGSERKFLFFAPSLQTTPLGPHTVTLEHCLVDIVSLMASERVHRVFVCSYATKDLAPKDPDPPLSQILPIGVISQIDIINFLTAQLEKEFASGSPSSACESFRKSY